MLACCNGTHYATTMPTVRKADGENPVEYVKIEMEEVLITSVSAGGSGGENRLTESVSLNFAKASPDYTPQGDKGAPLTAIPFGWDIAANNKE
jgi:type VI secretion system secreted protein Hcp